MRLPWPITAQLKYWRWSQGGDVLQETFPGDGSRGRGVFGGLGGGPCLAVGVCEENTESFQVWELGAGAHPCLASRDPVAEVLGMLAAELEKC